MIRHLIEPHETRLDRLRPSSAAPLEPFSLLEVLWWRRWTLILSTGICLALAIVYLISATRIYRATAALQFQEIAPTAIDDHSPSPKESEDYLETQINAIQSIGVLSDAMQRCDAASMATFRKHPDMVDWLRTRSVFGGDFKVEVPKKKADVILVSMDSPNAAEAIKIVNAVVDSYLADQARRNRQSGTAMLVALKKEQTDIESQRQSLLDRMLKLKQDNHVLSFTDEKQNIVSASATTLAASQTAAQLATIDLRAQLAAVKASMADPDSAVAFILGQSLKSKDFEDREFTELHLKLVELAPMLAETDSVQGAAHPRVQAYQHVAAQIREQIRKRALVIGAAQVQALTEQVAAAEENERQISSQLDAQWAKAMSLSPAAAAYARLESDAAQLAHNLETLGARIAEVAINRVEAPPFNAQVLDYGHSEPSAVKPNKMLILASSIMIGWVIGLGLAMAREWRDAPIRNPREILTHLGTPLVAVVPRINGRLSSVARGQIMLLDSRSPVAEAYRSARTTLRLGMGTESRKILVTSPAPAEGKSTTASNLAIALAQAGYRTLLMDCDLRGPVQHLIFKIDPGHGLCGALAGESTLREAVRSTPIHGLFVLPCGPVPLNPSEVLSSKRFEAALAALTESFDRIVIDSPPLASVSDARILAAQADGTLLVFRMNQSLRKLGALAVDGLEKAGANVIGAVANEAPADRSSAYYAANWNYAEPEDAWVGELNGHDDEEIKPRRNGNGNGKGNGLIPAISEPQWPIEVS